MAEMEEGVQILLLISFGSNCILAAFAQLICYSFGVLNLIPGGMLACIAQPCTSFPSVDIYTLLDNHLVLLAATHIICI